MEKIYLLLLLELYLQMLDDVLNYLFRVGLLILLLPFFNEGVIPILDHMFSAYPPKIPRDLSPTTAKKVHRSEELNVFLESPFPLLDVGVKVINPFLPALLKWLEDLPLGVAEHAKGYDFPLVDDVLFTV